MRIDLDLSERASQLLWVNAMRNFYADQPDRFGPMEGFDAPLPNDPVFEGGTMYWCTAGADVLMLRAYEEACGYVAVLLGDEAPDYDWCLLSTRPWKDSA